MTDKDRQTARTPDKDSNTRETREQIVEGAEARTRKQVPVDASRGRLNRVYSDVRIRAHHTNAELKMMRERASGFEDHYKKF